MAAMGRAMKAPMPKNREIRSLLTSERALVTAMINTETTTTTHTVRHIVRRIIGATHSGASATRH